MLTHPTWYDTINLQSILRKFLDAALLRLHRTKLFLLNFFARKSIWTFQVSLESRNAPRNYALDGSQCLTTKITFTVLGMNSVHSKAFDWVRSKTFYVPPLSSQATDTVESSTNEMHKQLFIYSAKSFIYKRKRSGSSIEPWEAHLFIWPTVLLYIVKVTIHEQHIPNNFIMIQLTIINKQKSVAIILENIKQINF